MAIFNFFLALTGLLMWSSCSHHQEEEPDVNLLPTVTFMNTLSGGGDKGYNDQILDGLMKFHTEQDVSLSMLHPCNLEEAGQLLDAWIRETEKTTTPALLVMADSEYLNILQQRTFTLSEQQTILLFECVSDRPLPDGVHTFRVGRYGVSYLAGCMASGAQAAYVIAATEGIATVDDAVRGFCDGFSATTHREATVHLLAEDYHGFSMPNEAYQFVSTLYDEFVFPVAGGSNSGIFKYTRDEPFSTLLIAGMDVDCSPFSTRVPFSVILPMNDILYTVLTDWLEEHPLPVHKNYLLGDELGAHIIVHPNFLEDVWIFEDYYEDPRYWDRLYSLHIEQAQQKEKIYYEK